LEGEQGRPSRHPVLQNHRSVPGQSARDFARLLVAAGTRAGFSLAAGRKFTRFPDSSWRAPVLRQIDWFLFSPADRKGDPAVTIPAASKAA
jgi:hypothetical protein